MTFLLNSESFTISNYDASPPESLLVSIDVARTIVSLRVLSAVLACEIRFTDDIGRFETLIESI